MNRSSASQSSGGSTPGPASREPSVNPFWTRERSVQDETSLFSENMDFNLGPMWLATRGFVARLIGIQIIPVYDRNDLADSDEKHRVVGTARLKPWIAADSISFGRSRPPSCHVISVWISNRSRSVGQWKAPWFLDSTCLD